MQKVIIAMSIAVLPSCSAFTSPRASLASIQDAAVAARLTIQPVIDGICDEAKRQCEESSRLLPATLTNCPAYDSCNRVRIIIINTLQAVQFAIADANLAVSLGQSDRADDAIARAVELLIEVQKQMQVLGIIPDGK